MGGSTIRVPAIVFFLKYNKFCNTVYENVKNTISQFLHTYIRTFKNIQSVLKSIATKAVYTKAEMNNEWNINFLKNNPRGIQSTYSDEFSTDQTTSEIILLACSTIIFFNGLKFSPWNEFSV